MAIPKSQKRTPQRIAPGGSARRFNRPFGNPLENYRRAQVDNLENPENEEDYNEETEQAQNENGSQQEQQKQQASQQAQLKNIAQRQIAQRQKQMAMRLLRQRLRKELIKKQVAGAVAKKAGSSLLVSTAGGISCTGCLTILAYIIIIGAALAIIIYVADFFGLV